MSERSKNKSVITGLLHKVSPRKTKTGKDVAGFIVAVIEGKARHHVGCVAWLGLAQRVTLMSPGSKVYVSGRLQCGSWTDANGNKRYKTEIVADTVEEIASLQSSPSPEALAKRPITDEDIPF
jgi:single-strand DNA-binding protein